MYVLLATNDDRQAQIFGNVRGEPFQTSGRAERVAAKLRKSYPHLHILVMPISEQPPLVNLLSRHALATADPR